MRNASRTVLGKIPTKFPTKSLALALALAITLASPRKAEAEPMREFILSCSYGVLAGTLVGAASLAFSDKPGDNLNRVARGASIGLYAGILLGLYVVYGVPGEDEDALAKLDSLEGTGVSSERLSFNHIEAVGPGRRSGSSAALLAQEPPRLALMPLIGERGVEGGALQVRVLNF